MYHCSNLCKDENATMKTNTTSLSSVLGLPTIFHIFSHAIPSEERSRAFGYLVALGSVGQTVASLVSQTCQFFEEILNQLVVPIFFVSHNYFDLIFTMRIGKSV